MTSEKLRSANSEKSESKRRKDQAAKNNRKPVNELLEINLGEKLDIDHVEQFREEITKARSLTKGIRLTCNACETIDLSFIQLIYALKNDLKKTNVELAIEIDEEQTELLKNTGVYKLIFSPQ